MVNAQPPELPQDYVELRRRLCELGRACRVLAHTGSTNDDLRAWAREGAPAGAVVVADAQSRGRGRHERAWSTPEGETIALSVLLRPPLSPQDLPKVALSAGLAARAAIDAALGGRGRPRIKWPNDVFVDGRKIAGVLVEGALSSARVEHAVVGIGVNVARTVFPPDLAGSATSIALEGGDTDRVRLVLGLLDALDVEVRALLAEPSALGARLRPWDMLLGRAVSLDDGRRGVASGIAEDGRLIVEVEGVTVLAHAGEVRVLPS